MKKKIYSIDLLYKGSPSPFVIREIEDIEKESGPFVDDPHRHNYYTVFWSYTSKGKHIIDFKDYPVEPQCLFFVSPWQVHQIIADPGSTGILILFTDEFLQKNSINSEFIANLKLFRDSDETPPLMVNDVMNKNLTSFVNGMMTTFTSENDMKFEIIGAWLKLFLIECNGHCSLFPGNNSQTIEVGRSLVKKFKQAVEKHYQQWHQVKDYADELNVTPGYLNEVIKTAIDKSAKEYIQNRIILEAKRLTLFTDKSFKEIGYELGFDDPSHFSKFFKSNTGLTFQELKETLTKPV